MSKLEKIFDFLNQIGITQRAVSAVAFTKEILAFLKAYSNKILASLNVLNTYFCRRYIF